MPDKWQIPKTWEMRDEREKKDLRFEEEGEWGRIKVDEMESSTPWYSNFQSGNTELGFWEKRRDRKEKFLIYFPFFICFHINYD